MTDPKLQSEHAVEERREGPGLVPDVDVTIVFPVQSEKAELENVIGALGGALTDLGLTWECILVFDGIKGALWDRALALQKETHDQVKEESYNRALGFTRKSLTYLEGRATMLDREFSK